MEITRAGGFEFTCLNRLFFNVNDFPLLNYVDCGFPDFTIDDAEQMKQRFGRTVVIA